MKTFATLFLAGALTLSAGAAPAADETTAPAKPRKVYVVVFDFECKDSPRVGRELADSVRLYISRHDGYEIIDPMTTKDAAPAPLPPDTPRATVEDMMINKIAANFGLYGQVQKVGQGIRADILCVDLTDPNNKQGGWSKQFSDNTERSRGMVARQIAEFVTNRAEWNPPEYGDEPEPKNFGKPININGDFQNGGQGWEVLDNVSTFVEAGPPSRGKVLRIRTDLKRDPWYEYTRKLMLGQADPNHPPQIDRDTSYDCLGGQEGVLYRGDWIDAKPGQRYWLVADGKFKTDDFFFPKIYVKGFADWTDKTEAVHERSLLELKMTAKDYAALPPDKRKELLAADVKNHPDRYRREVFRWFLSCRNLDNAWKHYGAPFPPRGGLPANVQWLRVEIHAYWPPQEFLFANVNLYLDPTQKAPQAEEPARTKLSAKANTQPNP